MVQCELKVRELAEVVRDRPGWQAMVQYEECLQTLRLHATQGEERENALDGYDRKLWRIAVVEYNRLWVDYGYKQSSPVASQKSSLFIRDSCVYAGKPLSSEVCRTSPERN